MCPSCGDSVPIATLGRPPTYCTVACRREMARRRRDLAAKEAELVEARQRAADGYAPGSYFWRGSARMLETQAAELRARVPEAMR